jgi:predicted metal-binding membrane protein
VTDRFRRLDLGLGLALLGLAALAWYALWVHNRDAGMAMAVSAPAYLATWVVMLAAMMLPATMPLAIAYGRVARARGGNALAALAFSGGYLLLWTVAGLVPLGLYLGSRGAIAGMTGAMFGTATAVVLALAGLYQLSPLKGACLRACRSPLGFLMTHDFDSGFRGGVIAGGSHGLACLGCCWVLMAMLLVAGLMSLPWMGLLGALILAEKNWRRGETLARAAGFAMLAAGAVMAVAVAL